MNESKQVDVPTPIQSERDRHGRLTAVAIDSDLPMPGAAQASWLVAIDGSKHSLAVAAQAVRLASLMTTPCLHLVNVQAWLGKEAAEAELPQRGWAATASARAVLDAAGLPWRLHLLMGEAPELIVTLAEHLGCAGIVIGSRGLSATEALLLGSVAYKVVNQSKLSVLLVR